jgi:hypothetical protein
MLDSSEDTYTKLKEAYYKHSQFLELRGNLPASCPNNEICRERFKDKISNKPLKFFRTV